MAGGGLEAGEPVHRDHLQAVPPGPGRPASGLGTPAGKRPSTIASSRDGPVRSRTGVKSVADGDEPVTPTGVPPHVLVDADHLHVVEAGQVVEQHPADPQPGQRCWRWSTTPRGPRRDDDAEMLTNQPDQRPPQRGAGQLRPRPRGAAGVLPPHARSRCSGTGGS